MLVDPKLKFEESKTAASAAGLRTFAAIVAATKVAPTLFLNCANGLAAGFDSVQNSNA